MDFQNLTKILIMVTMFVLGVHEEIKAQPRMGDLNSEQRSCMEKNLGAPSEGRRPDMSKLKKIMEKCGVEAPAGEPGGEAPPKRSETEGQVCETCAAKRNAAQLDQIKDHAGDIESKARESSDRERLMARVETMKCPDAHGEVTEDDLLGELDEKSMEILEKNYNLMDSLDRALEKKAKKCQKLASRKQNNQQPMMGMNGMGSGMQNMGSMMGSMMGNTGSMMGSMNMNPMGMMMGQNAMGNMSQLSSYNPYMMSNPYMSHYSSMSMPTVPSYNYGSMYGSAYGSSMYGSSLYNPYQSTQMTSFPNWMMSRPYGQ